MSTIKCMIIGDGTVGKTCMVISYTSDEFPTEYVPTVFDSYTMTITISGQQYSLELFDTAGQEDYDRIRQLTYPKTDVFLICYSVVDPDSYENVKAKWLPEIKQQKMKCPYLLVGTKSDLRDDQTTLTSMANQNVKPTSAEEGIQMARRIGATKYVECSALTRAGLKNVFDEAITAVLNPQKSKGNIMKKMKNVFL